MGLCQVIWGRVKEAAHGSGLDAVGSGGDSMIGRLSESHP